MSKIICFLTKGSMSGRAPTSSIVYEYATSVTSADKWVHLRTRTYGHGNDRRSILHIRQISSAVKYAALCLSRMGVHEGSSNRQSKACQRLSPFFVPILPPPHGRISHFNLCFSRCCALHSEPSPTQE